MPHESGWIGRLLSARGVVAFWALYGIVHAALRLSFSRTLSLDDSRASELVQSLALGYQARQPPLYEWLLWCSQRIFGTGLESHIALRYALVAALGISAFVATRTAIRDTRWAAVASLSLVATYPVGWTFHEWATQTILLSIACFLTLDAALRHLEKPSLRTAAWLGLAVGLGLMAKFSYPIFLAGLFLALLSMSETRRALADARLILSAAIALAMTAPYLVWLFEVRGSVVGAISHTMIQTQQSHLLRALIGLRRLALSLPLFLLPWLAFVALLAPWAFRKPDAGAPPPGMAERLALRTMMFAAMLAAIGVAAIGATNVAERYMHAILIVAPVYLFARVARLAPQQQWQPIRRFAVFMLSAAAVILAVRFAAFVDNGVSRRADRPAFIPYQQLAQALAERGLADGTAIAPDIRTAGNLHAFLPDLRVMSPESFRLVRPARRAGDERSCVLVMDANSDANRIAPVDGLAREKIEVSAPPSPLGRPRRASWDLIRLDPHSPACE